MTAHRSSTPGVVSVDLARREERPLLEGLFQFYAYDFSEFSEGAEFEFDQTGRIPIDPRLELYWTEADRWPLLIRADGCVAGFALINTVSHRGGRVERNMAEFFIARRFRRSGIATAAVHTILGDFPGVWEIAVAARNAAALAFWPRAVASARNVSDIVQLEGDGVHWRGPIWSFVAASTRP